MEGTNNQQPNQQTNFGAGAQGSNVQVDFAIGKTDKDTGKAKVKNLEEIAEERMR